MFFQYFFPVNVNKKDSNYFQTKKIKYVYLRQIID